MQDIKGPRWQIAKSQKQINYPFKYQARGEKHTKAAHKNNPFNRTVHAIGKKKSITAKSEAIAGNHTGLNDSILLSGEGFGG